MFSLIVHKGTFPANTPVWVPCGINLGTGNGFDEGNVSGMRVGTVWANRDDLCLR